MTIKNQEIVRIVAIDSEGNSFPVGLTAKTQRRRSAPYAKWGIINLEGPVLSQISNLNQTQGRILLALIFSANPLRLKDLSAIVGAPTSQVCRAAKVLVETGLAEKVDGRYRPTTLVRWIGRWKQIFPKGF
jgi:hypothetical protein